MKVPDAAPYRLMYGMDNGVADRGMRVRNPFLGGRSNVPLRRPTIRPSVNIALVSPQDAQQRDEICRRRCENFVWQSGNNKQRFDRQHSHNPRTLCSKIDHVLRITSYANV